MSVGFRRSIVFSGKSIGTTGTSFYIDLYLFILRRSSKYGIITGCLRFGMVKVRFCTATAQEWQTRERGSIMRLQVSVGQWMWGRSGMGCPPPLLFPWLMPAMKTSAEFAFV